MFGLSSLAKASATIQHKTIYTIHQKAILGKSSNILVCQSSIIRHRNQCILGIDKQIWICYNNHMNNKLKKTITYLISAIIFAISPIISFAGQAPTMGNLPVSGLTSTNATLNGTFTSNGYTTKIMFEYGDTPLMLQKTSYQTKSATDSGNFSAVINITPTAGKKYFYRSVGINSLGIGYGTPTESFVVPNTQVISLPTIMTVKESGVSSTSATLNGFFNGNGSPTTTSFEYGTSSTLGSSTSQISTLNGFGYFQESIAVQAGTKYYFRAVATNSAGTKNGSIFNFTTTGTVPPTTTQCNDGIDNDGNGLTDYPADLACSALTDNTEAGYIPPVSYYQCNNGIDDDGDGTTDYPQDLGCVAFNDNTESPDPYVQPAIYQCNDGIDNDNNGFVDYPNDKGCYSLFDNTEHGYTVGVAPKTTSTVETGVTKTSAKLHGISINTSGVPTNTWFEYDKTLSFGKNTQSTNSISSSTQINFSYTISGLSPNTAYFWRAVSQNKYGISYGGTVIFKTNSNGSNNNIVVNSTTAEYVSLKITNPYKQITSGDTVDFTITYKNTSGKTFKDALLRVIFPKEITFKRSSDGNYSSSNNALTLVLGTLSPNQSGSLSIQGIASGKSNDNIVTSATIAYTGISNNAQYDAVAYTMNEITGSSNGSLFSGASIFSGGGLLPTSIVGWLLLVIVIFLLIYFGRKMYTKKI